MTASTQALTLKRSAWFSKALPAAYVTVVCLCLLAAFVYKMRIDGVFACPASGYGPDAYLSDCTASNFGDYDHGAFWFGLEPQAKRAVSEADVVFIGSSRLQFALSGANRQQWFKALGISHYLLGFSHSETVSYFDPLLAKLHPRAKVYVLNVDRLFEDRVTAPTEQLLHSHDARQRYEEKRNWQAIHARVCGALPALCGNAIGVYRTRTDGSWRRLGSAPFAGQSTSDGKPSNVERWDRYAALAEAFVERLPVDRGCVILTLVPTVQTKRDEALAIAAKLGLPLVSPQLDGLRTFDGSHLDEASATRWSNAFLQAAGPQLRHCVRGGAG
ncbi:MAG TPA: hypothetical protein VFU71_18410 [Burkholderiaceae bacterium]|nr:hypothetical protein [Burkholderiaceae bacterium]